VSFIRELKRGLRFKLIKLEEAKFDACVRAFRLIRNKILDDSDVTDKEERRARFDAEDVEAGAKTTADLETALFTEVGKALSFWASLEEILVGIASLLLSNSLQKAGVVMYSIINFGTWLGIITELFPQPRHAVRRHRQQAGGDGLERVRDAAVLISTCRESLRRH
jgi:hypothetical protein